MNTKDLFNQIKNGKIAEARETFNSLMNKKKEKVYTREYKTYVSNVFAEKK